MTRLLLLLSLIGAAIYAFLIYTHNVLTDEKAEKTYAEQAQPKQPVEHVSSWDTYLPDRSTNQNPKLATSQPIKCLLGKLMSLAKIPSETQTKLLPQRIKRHSLKAATRSQSRLS